MLGLQALAELLVCTPASIAPYAQSGLLCEVYHDVQNHARIHATRRVARYERVGRTVLVHSCGTSLRAVGWLACALREVLVLTAATPALAAPQGWLRKLIDRKEKEVDRLYERDEATRDDGQWSLRMRYSSADFSYKLLQALSEDENKFHIIADLKRTSPAEDPLGLGVVESVDEGMDVRERMAQALELGCTAAMISTDRTFYGSSIHDVRTARKYLNELRFVSPDASSLPLVAKDFYIDPVQMAQALCEGADTVLVNAAIVGNRLEQIIDTCTGMGIDAIVEIHTLDELDAVCEESPAVIIVNQRDRKTGKVQTGLAASMGYALPPHITCLASGDIHSLEQVRELRQSGYDGAVIGRGLLKPGIKELFAELAEDDKDPEWRLSRLLWPFKKPEPEAEEPPELPQINETASQEDAPEMSQNDETASQRVNETSPVIEKS